MKQFTFNQMRFLLEEAKTDLKTLDCIIYLIPDIEQMEYRLPEAMVLNRLIEELILINNNVKKP